MTRPNPPENPAPQVKPAASSTDNPGNGPAPADSPAPDAANTSNRTPPLQPGAAWKYKPLPPASEEPDPHDESQKLNLELPGRWQVLGARVRGKKHKHEGTHCDDWFEVRWADPWVLIAVADGAGSYRFSRVGARVSCQAAVEHLARELGGRPLRTRHGGLLSSWWSRDDGALNADDTAHVEKALRDAMPAAYEALRQAAQERADSELHQKILRRKVTTEDLSSTLLLAAVTRVKVKDEELTFAATCSVGDGMMVMIAEGNDPVQLLAVPDSGEHSGETYFLTSRGRLDPANLKVTVALRPMRAVLVMTDGVADDYFPQQTEMLRLYADLVLNRVVTVPPSGVTPPPALPVELEQARAACEQELDVLSPDSLKVKLRAAKTFAEKMGLSIADLVAGDDLLRAGAADFPEAGSDPAERLRLWLDAYQVRGSFDDRTLVVLHREVLS